MFLGSSGAVNVAMHCGENISVDKRWEAGCASYQYALHEVVEENFHFVLKNSLFFIVSKTFDDFSPLVVTIKFSTTCVEVPQTRQPCFHML